MSQKRSDKMFRKIRLPVILLAAAWLVVASGCSVGAKSKVTLVSIGMPGPRYGLSTNGMIKEYVKVNPNVEIKHEGYPEEEYIGKIALDVAGGGGAYDIIWIDYKFIGGYADANYLYPIDKFLLGNPSFWKDIQNDIYPVVLDMYKYKDHWYAIPNDGNTHIMYHRKDLLQEAGVELPESWSELFEIAPKLHNPPEVYALGGHMRRNYAADMWFTPFVSAGGWYWNKDYVPQVNSEAGVKAAEIMKRIYKWSPPDAISWEESEYNEALGNAGIIAIGPTAWGGNVLTNPDLAKFADKIGTALPPGFNGESPTVPLGGYGLGINAKSQYKDEAWKFIMFYTARENQEMLVSYTGQPVRNSALTDPVNIKVAPYLPAIGKNSKYGVPRPVIAEFAKVEQILGVELMNVLLGDKSAKQAMDDANAAMYTIMASKMKK